MPGRPTYTFWSYRNLAGALLVLVPVLALIPLLQAVHDEVELSSYLTDVSATATPLGFDWVTWQEEDGDIVATYVFPDGPAASAGIEEGDVLFMLDGQQYFQADLLKRVIEGLGPGATVNYFLLRDGESVVANVALTAYPPFLYPLSESLWLFSIWGFTLGAFLHVLGLVIAGPLALRSPKARFSLLLIATSSLWILGNLLRLLMVEFFGPPSAGTTYDAVFQGLTLIGLAGWIGFPVLLLRKVVSDTQLPRPVLPVQLHRLAYLPPIVLGIWALVSTLPGRLGLLTLADLIAPILFYVCCYVALAALLSYAYYRLQANAAEEAPGGWGRFGSGLTFLIALVAALAVPGILPVFGTVADTTTGWLIISGQLLSIVPITLVSLSTLKLGKIDQVLTRAVTYLTVLGLLFFAVVGGLAVIDRYPYALPLSRNVLAGVYVVGLLLLFERLARRIRVYAAGFFATERQRTRKRLTEFQEKMRTILDHESLIRRTIHEVGEAFDARTAVLYVQLPGEGGAWISSRYQPDPPYLTERVVSHIWPFIEREGRIWARNAELNESALPERLTNLLVERGAVLVVPIMGDGRPMGVIILGPRRQRGSVFNLEDLDLLRALSGQLALAVERLSLFEREKDLVRQSAEAQLVALRAQINPHFLFNALNTIISFIEEHPDEAEAIVEHLAAIFRHILQTGGRSFVSMEDELALVDHYLSIEQARFEDKLTVERWMDPALRSHPVPAFAIQTLVENAVKHGLEKKRNGGVLTIEAHLTPDGLAKVTVHDSGVGIPDLFDAPATAGKPAFFGLGLNNVADRLEQLYGRTDLLRIRSLPSDGTTVTLLLPPDRADLPLAPTSYKDNV